MAERRMFAKTVIDSDAFTDMPVSARLLYYDLSMRADDDGFINNPKKIQRMIGVSEDDLKLLIIKNFIIPFESGIVVIKHWKIHNYIRNDRYKPTNYKEEKCQLETKENGSYTLGIPNGYQMDTQVRLGKVRLGKVSLGKSSLGEDRTGEDCQGELEIFKKIGLYSDTTLSKPLQLKLDNYKQLVRELIQDNQFDIIDKLNLNILEKCYIKCKGQTNIINYLKSYIMQEIAKGETK